MVGFIEKIWLLLMLLKTVAIKVCVCVCLTDLDDVGSTWLSRACPPGEGQLLHQTPEDHPLVGVTAS